MKDDVHPGGFRVPLGGSQLGSHKLWPLTHVFPYGCQSKPIGCHFGVVYFCGDWDVHWGYGVLTPPMAISTPENLLPEVLDLMLRPSWHQQRACCWFGQSTRSEVRRNTFSMEDEVFNIYQKTARVDGASADVRGVSSSDVGAGTPFWRPWLGFKGRRKGHQTMILGGGLRKRSPFQAC